MIVTTVLVLFTAVIVGIVVHEATHWAVGAAMGTFRAAGVGFSKQRYLQFVPTAFVVVQSRENYASRFSPLVWLLPLIAIQPVYYSVPVAPRLFVLVFSVVAGGTVLVSDLPDLLFDMDIQNQYRWLWLVDKR